MSNYANHSIDRYKVELQEKWLDEIYHKIPPLQFNPEWKVLIVPPFGGAVARFVVKKNGKQVSVYLDWFSRLGCMDQPYYEIYPNLEGDCSRFYLDETDQMMEAIAEVLK